MRTCETCKHFRQTEGVDRDGTPITLGYCHATRNFAYRTPECTCKRYSADPQKVLFK